MSLHGGGKNGEGKLCYNMVEVRMAREKLCHCMVEVKMVRGSCVRAWWRYGW